MKKLYAFVAIMAAATVSAQTTVNFVMANQGWNNAQAVTSGTIDSNLSFTVAKNAATSAPAYYTGDSSLRFYYTSSGNGGGMTITPANGAIINSVTINAVAGNTPTVKYSVDEGALQTASLNGTAYTISGLNAAKSFMFQNANTTSAQLRVTSLSVTYTMPSLAVINADEKKINFLKSTVVDNSVEFGVKADVKIYDMNGRMVKAASVNDGTSLDVSSLAKGVYIVAGEVEGQKVSQKIIKK